MDPKRAAHQKVTALVRQFFDELTNAMRAGISEVWRMVEQRLSQQSPPSDAKHNRPAAPTQQPVQQQQSRIGPDET